MVEIRAPRRESELCDLLRRDHTLNGGILFGIDGYIVAAMNPCPCGFYGTDQCRCTEREVKRYQQKISGPILDRIDLQVELERLSLDERFAETEDDVSPRIRRTVEKARERQRQRFEGTRIPYNSAIPGGHVRGYCDFSPEGFDAYKRIIEESRLSTRSMDRLAKVGRTIADIRGSDTLEPEHIKEGASFVVGGMLRDTF